MRVSGPLTNTGYRAPSCRSADALMEARAKIALIQNNSVFCLCSLPDMACLTHHRPDLGVHAELIACHVQT